MGVFNFLGGPSVVASSYNSGGFEKFISQIEGPINVAMIVMLVVVAASAIMFAIWVAFKLAKAEDEGKRKEAKQQLMWSLIAIVACATLIVLFLTLFAPGNSLFNATNMSVTATGSLSIITNAGNQIINAINGSVGCILKLVACGGIFYGVYVGFRLATASDEGKRKEAKAQLLWSMVAVVAALVLSMAITLGLSAMASAL